jgi:hypothetical protein
VELRSQVCQPQAPDGAISDGVAQSDDDQMTTLFASDSLEETVLWV